MKVLKVALFFAVVRVGIGLLLYLMQRSSPEASMLVILDMPTLGGYLLLGLFGWRFDIIDAADPRFFVIGVISWLIVGLCIGGVVAAVTAYRKHHSSVA